MRATRRPPEGALAGENVPIENDREEINAERVEEIVTALGNRPGYDRSSREKRREKAREIVRDCGGGV